MEQTEDNIAWALEKFEELVCLPGFPPSARPLRGIAKAFLRIVGPIADDWRSEYDPESANGEKRITVPGHTADEVADWLIAEILDKCERFPAPIVMRRLYEEHPEHWVAADGRRSGNMGLED
ncbi:MAG TPA: hypothetical protein VFW94_15005 [Candidatus Acidoferrales bacterium]|nr:hypothetical protein [Candidatus Acidoferrales bacterium]